MPDSENCLSLKELCEEICISTATGRNWIKLGKLTPEYTEKNTPYFTKGYVSDLKNEISSGKNAALKSRRNKKYISGNVLCHSYVSDNCKNIWILQNVLQIIAEEEIELSTDIIQYIVADCALRLFSDKLQLSIQTPEEGFLLKYLNGDIDLQNYNILIDAFIENKESAGIFCRKHAELFRFHYLYEPNEDILGLIYISCKNVGNRKATGSYYTPTKVVRKLISKLDFTDTDKILDPCCGTGNFLLQLPENIHFENIYGNDIDAISVKITRLNMALKYRSASIEDICKHITKMDYLTEYSKSGFDYIIGNPPWGYEFSDKIKDLLRENYEAASGKNIESYDVFIERALSNLALGGQLSYVLPEAVLNVKAHKAIRKIILQSSSIKYLEFDFASLCK